MQNNIDTFEIIKYLLGIIVSIVGVYLGFVIKSMSKDICQLKEFLMTHIDDIKDNLLRHRKDIDHLYNLHRETSEITTENKTDLKALRSEFYKCQERKNDK